MAYAPISTRPTGGMDSDTNLLEVKKGDYLDMLNARHIANNGNANSGGGGDGDVEIVLGAEDESFTIGTVDTQNKKYRIYVYAITGDVVLSSSSLTFYDPNFNVLFTTALYANTVLIGTTLITCAAAISAAAGATLPVQNITITQTSVDSTYGYVEVNLTNINSLDWTLELFSDTSDSSIQISQEAIDVSLAGDLKVIGSKELNGDLFIWSTTQTELPSELTVTGATNATPIVITATAHGISTGEEVIISGVLGNTNANGKWIITSTGANTFSLGGSAGSGAYTSGGTVIVNHRGLGSVGVAQRNENNKVWTYTKLITSTQFNLVTKHQIDARVEQGSLYKNLYFTDYYNYPRTLKYNGNYATNGFINILNSDGLYDYITLNDESLLILGAPNVSLSVTQQQNGGKLNAGNKRYAVRFITTSGVSTQWTYLTNPIPVYSVIAQQRPGGVGQYIHGDDGGRATTKMHTITVTGISYGLYDSIELAYVEYTDLAITGYIVTTQKLPSNSTGDFTLTHTGYETDSKSLDLGSLNAVGSGIIAAQNIELLDNRLVLSKIKSQTDYDLDAWAQTITHSIQRKSIAGLGILSNRLYYNVAEYAVAENVEDYLGYMHNETYRFGIQVKWKHSEWSATYWVNDITIDCTTSGRQTGLTNFDLTSSSTTTAYDVYVPYIRFTNIDLDYQLSDGRVLRNLIEAFRIVRAGCIKEVLGAGVACQSYYDGFGFGNAPNYYTLANPYNPATNQQGRIGFLRSADLYLGKDQITYAASDVILTQGNPIFMYQLNQGANRCNEFNGNFSALTAYDSYALDGAGNTENGAQTIGGSNVYFAPAGILSEQNSLAFKTTNAAGITAPAGNPNTVYGIPYCQYFRAITDKYGDVATTKYITTGHIEIDVTTVTATDTYDVYGGDTFTQKSYLAIDITNAAVKYCMGFYSQQRVNTQMVYFDSAYPAAGYPNVSGSTNAWFGLALTDSNLYDRGYNSRNGLQNSIGFDATAPQIEDLYSRIYYSDKKIEGTLVDSYQSFLPLNFRDLNASNGSIEGMFAINGELMTWQKNKFERQFFNSNDTLETGGGTSILIGDGAVLGRVPIDLSAYGCSHKWAIIKSQSAGGKDVAYWISVENKRVMRFGADGTVVLSDIKDMATYFDQNLDLLTYCNTPADDLGIHGFSWLMFKEVGWTIRAQRQNTTSNGTTILGYLTWATSTSYAVGDIIIVSGNTYYNSFEQMDVFYVCTVAHTSGSSTKPQTGVSWETKWERKDSTDTDYNDYVQLYTIVFSEFNNSFTHRYSPKPKIYLEYKDTILAPNPIDENGIYEYNKGDYAKWFCSTTATGITLTYTSGSATVTGAGATFLTYFLNIGFNNKFYVIIGGVDYEILSVESDTSLTLRDAMTSSGTQADFNYKNCCSDDAHIETVQNQPYEVIKWWASNRFDTEIVPERVEYTTEQHASYLVATDFRNKDLNFDAPIKNDSTVSADNPTGINSIRTSKLWGRWLKTKVYMQNGTYQRLHNFITKAILMGRNYQG